MVKTKIISNGKIDKHGMKKVGKSFLLTLGAAAIGWIASSTGVIDYGSSETIVATCLPFLANFLYKLMGKYEVKA
jgi:hypothetical protein